MANITIMAKNEVEIYKPVSVVHIKGDPTLQQRKAWNWLVKNASKKLATEELHQVSIQQLKKCLGHSPTNNDYDQIENSLIKLINTVVIWNVMEKDKDDNWKKKEFIASGMLASCFIESGVCTYAFSPHLRQKLNERLMYIKINLLLQNQFNSVYSLALYEFLKTYYIEKNKKGLTSQLKLKDFREIMGIKPKEYADFRDLNKYVIKSALKEINAKSDIFAGVTLIKEKRKVVALQFEIIENKDKEKNMKKLNQMIDSVYETDLISEVVDGHEPNPLKTKLEKLDFGESQISKFLNEKDQDKVMDSVDYVLMRMEKGATIKNLTAYLNTILEMHREGGLDVSAVEDWRAKQAKIEQEKIDKEKRELEVEDEEQKQDKLSKLKKEKIVEYSKKHPKEVKKICEVILKDLENNNKFIFGQVEKVAKKKHASMVEAVKICVLTAFQVETKIWEKIEEVEG